MNRSTIKNWAQKHSWLIELLYLLIITLPAVFSLINNQYFSMHDDQHIVRLFLLDQGIKQGQLYPRWVDGLGFSYGYPLYNFYPPLIYYIAEFFHLIGFSLIWSIKLMIISGYLLAATGMFYLAKRVFGKASAILSSVVYTYFVYHTITVYVRGALAEFFSFAVLPFVFLSFDRLAEKQSWKNVLFFAIALALLVLNHPLIAFPALIFIGLAGIYYVWLAKNKVRFMVMSAIAGLWGLGFSAFFWLPSMVERKYTLVDKILTTELASYAIHFVYPFQFWYSQWGYGGSAAGPVDGMSFQLGKIPLLLAFVSIIAAIYCLIKRRKQPELTYGMFAGLMTTLALFMTTEFSKFIWDRVQFLSYLQFPWRFLTFAAVFMSLFCSFWLINMGKKQVARYVLAAVFALLMIGIYQKYDRPQFYRNVTDHDLTTRDEVVWRISRSSFEFIPKEVATIKSDLNTTIPAITPESIPTVSAIGSDDEANFKITKNSFREKVFDFHAPDDYYVQLYTFYFPGWKAYLSPKNRPDEEKEVEIDVTPKLRWMRVNTPPGDWHLRVVFEDTPIRTLANNLTILSLLIALVLPIYFKYYGNSSKR